MIRAIAPRACALLFALTAFAGCAALTDVVDPMSGSGRYRLLTDFVLLPETDCLQEGRKIGGWVIRYTGYGCVASGDSTENPLIMTPRPATSPDRTHAALVVGPLLPSHYSLSATFRTPRQIRVNSEPNAWEVAWLVWSFVDDQHFYYFIPKREGWELGKRDPAYPGGQRFLATGEWPVRATDRWQSVEVEVEPGVMRVSMEGEELVRFVDQERPIQSGRVALYTEDAEIHVREVDLTY